MGRPELCSVPKGNGAKVEMETGYWTGWWKYELVHIIYSGNQDNMNIIFLMLVAECHVSHMVCSKKRTSCMKFGSHLWLQTSDIIWRCWWKMDRQTVVWDNGIQRQLSWSFTEAIWKYICSWYQKVQKLKFGHFAYWAKPQIPSTRKV